MDILVRYIANELVPMTIVEAVSKQLFRSWGVKGSLDALRKSLAAALDLALDSHKAQISPFLSMTTALQQFSKRLSLPWFGDDALSAKKDEHIKIMAKNMVDDIGDQRLILTIIIMKLAQERDGLIYATNEFTIRLMEFLNPSNQEFCQCLKQLYDAVKENKLTADDREGMREIATKVAERSRWNT